MLRAALYSALSVPVITAGLVLALAMAPLIFVAVGCALALLAFALVVGPE